MLARVLLPIFLLALPLSHAIAQDAADETPFRFISLTAQYGLPLNEDALELYTGDRSTIYSHSSQVNAWIGFQTDPHLELAGGLAWHQYVIKSSYINPFPDPSDPNEFRRSKTTFWHNTARMQVELRGNVDLDFVRINLFGGGSMGFHYNERSQTTLSFFNDLEEISTEVSTDDPYYTAQFHFGLGFEVKITPEWYITIGPRIERAKVKELTDWQEPAPTNWEASVPFGVLFRW